MTNYFLTLGIDSNHLSIWNTWQEEVYENNESTWNPWREEAYENNEPTCKDSCTGEQYFSDSKRIIFICEATLGLIPHLIAVVTAFAYRIFVVFSFYSFWKEGEMSTYNRFIEWSVEATRVVIAPLAIPFLFLTAVYGIYNSQHGKKIHSRMETIFYGHPLIVLCMHPQPPKDALFEHKLRKFQVIIIKSLLIHPIKIVAASLYHVALVISFRAFWKGDTSRLGVKLGNWLRDVGNLITLAAIPPISFFAALLTLASKEKGEAFYLKVQDSLYGDLAKSFAKCEVLPLGPSPHFVGLSKPDGFSDYENRRE